MSGPIRDIRPSLSFGLLIAFLVVVWLTGGASRADVLGQAFVRAAAWGVLLVIALFGPKPKPQDLGPVGIFLALAALLALMQLIPLPPAIWQHLPGRALLAEAAAVSGESQPWRPWSVVPGATINAASSLIVPITILILAASLDPTERLRVPGILLCLMGVSALIGLLQFSGAHFDNPLVNDTPGEVAGLFANRNHFALFIAIGCILAPTWAFQKGRRSAWRGPMALALVLLFDLIILASGSRAGIIFALFGSTIGLVLAWKGIRKSLQSYPRWVFPALIAGVAALVAVAVLISIKAGRAVSISRVMAIDPGSDMRHRGLPTVLGMIREYFPWGSGLGAFDPVFRQHEPFDLLKPTFFNHAHNDFLEIVLDAGVFGVLLMIAAIGWWFLASLRAWRGGDSSKGPLPKLGSVAILLILIGSVFDYPARTPMIMTMIVLAGLWLDSSRKASSPSALPQGGEHL